MQKSTQQKLFGKKYNQLAIILSALLLLTIIIILSPLSSFITGSHRKYTENVAEIYQDYWEYSLGNYTFKRTDGHRDDPYNSTVDWYNYIFTFTDINGNPREISVDNLYWKRGSTTSNTLDNQLISRAGTFLKKDIIQLFNEQNILDADGIKVDSTRIDCFVRQIDKNINPTSTENGIKFNSLSLNTLAKNNINLRVNIYVDITGKIIDYPNIRQMLIDATNIIFECHEYSNIEIRFVMRPSDLNGSNGYTDYFLTYDGINYHWSDSAILVPASRS